MADICLINPDSVFLTDPRVMPPLGILSIMASLKEQGYSAEFVDLAGGNNVDIPDCDLYGITSTTAQYPAAVKIKNKLKSKYPNSSIIIGGAHATVVPDNCLNDGFDAVLVGEGELHIQRFLNGERGKIIGIQTKNLDQLPFPDRKEVIDYSYTIDGLKATTIMTSRGCPYKCSFCAKTWSGIRFRSSENVLKEALEIKELGFKALMCYDDEFLFSLKRDREIFEGFNKLGLIWRCFTRADLLLKNPEMAEFMAKNGCREVLIGVESGDDDILRNINKGTTAKINEKAIKTLHAAGIRVKAAMIIGLPGETNETLKNTYEFCERLDPYVSDWDFSVLIPYPGSDLYENSNKYDIKFDKKDIYKPFKMNEGWEALVSTESLTREEITKKRNEFHARFKK